MSVQTVTIDALGAKGDGIAKTDSGAVFVPFTLPGETVGIALNKNQGTLVHLKSASSDRVEPPCPHFGPDAPAGACGGCALQHMAITAYHQFKRGLVVKAIDDAGLAAEVAPLFVCHEGERRRMTLSARRGPQGIVLGLQESGSHSLVPISVCHVAAPAISEALPALRTVANAVLAGNKPLRMSVLATASGLDVAATGSAPLSDRQRLMAIETVLGLAAIARLTLNGEIIVEPRKPIVHFGSIPIHPPSGTFLQASARAEAQMAALVGAHLAGAKRVADLFSGCGTFALRLAARSAVHAVENDRAALATLDAARRSVQGLKPVTHQARDLFRSPLMPHELKAFDGVVFDPPRAGAEAQAHELARSKVAKIAAVSCNPVTLARDLAILAAGGYRITTIVPIDQFLWSPHVEAVALLER